jgi:hypothetical protein
MTQRYSAEIEALKSELSRVRASETIAPVQAQPPSASAARKPVDAGAFNGDNEKMFQKIDAEQLPSRSAPRLYTGFVKFAPPLPTYARWTKGTISPRESLVFTSIFSHFFRLPFTKNYFLYGNKRLVSRENHLRRELLPLCRSVTDVNAHCDPYA